MRNRGGRTVPRLWERSHRPTACGQVKADKFGFVSLCDAVSTCHVTTQTVHTLAPSDLTCPDQTVMPQRLPDEQARMNSWRSSGDVVALRFRSGSFKVRTASNHLKGILQRCHRLMSSAVCISGR